MGGGFRQPLTVAKFFIIIAYIMIFLELWISFHGWSNASGHST